MEDKINIIDPVTAGMMKVIQDAAEANQIKMERVPYLQAITATNLTWRFEPTSAKVIKVCFGPTGGNYGNGVPYAMDTEHGKKIAKAIIKTAPEWLVGINMKFDFGPPDGPLYKCPDKLGHEQEFPIRINVEYQFSSVPVYGSLIGNTSAFTNIQDSTYSMTLPFKPFHNDWVTPERQRYFILHEFGHALGFLHELQRVDCKWNYSYLVSRGYFPDQDTAKNVLQYLKDPTRAYRNVDGSPIETEINITPIMRYDFQDVRAFDDGADDQCYTKTWTSSLTNYDKQGVRMACKDYLDEAAFAFAVQGGSDSFSELKYNAPLVANLLTSKQFAISEAGDFAEFKKNATKHQLKLATTAVNLSDAELKVVREALSYRAKKLLPASAEILGNGAGAK